MDPNQQQSQQQMQSNQQYQNPQQSQMPVKSKTNVLAIVGLVLSFFIAPVGLILSIVALPQIKKRGEAGKGLAIAGIIVSSVIIVMNLLLLALILPQFANTQARARDSERKADIRLIVSYLDNYKLENSFYPDSLDDLSGINQEALKGPNAGEVYEYVATPAGCTTEDLNCTAYSISSNNMEKEDNPYLKNSLY